MEFWTLETETVLYFWAASALDDGGVEVEQYLEVVKLKTETYPCSMPESESSSKEEIHRLGNRDSDNYNQIEIVMKSTWTLGASFDFLSSRPC